VNPALAHALRAPPQADICETVAQWWPGWLANAAANATPMARAIAGGFAADRVAWAFASGYQAALRGLLPDLVDDAMAAICVTEETGNRPRDIATTITHGADGSIAISGAKRWTTLGPASTLLLVVGREAGEGTDDKPRLRVARVPTDAPGVSVSYMPETRFVPEVPHARVQLAGVRLPAAALLPGDGYVTCVKPFRTLEDTYVTVAVLAYLLREARARSWPADLRERIVAALTALSAVAEDDADSPLTHVALEGALRFAHQLYADAAPLWSAAADAAATRWQRDAALFAVAGTVRALRATRAWERLATEGTSDD
jgi:alkylation response protein AidB-like acyl-CoA dehydrogenase